jgi:hypothetical protein
LSRLKLRRDKKERKDKKRKVQSSDDEGRYQKKSKKTSDHF